MLALRGGLQAALLLLCVSAGEPMRTFPGLQGRNMVKPCFCGISGTMSRVVGGTQSQKSQFPWMAMLSEEGKFYCGGSLINDRYILTAAHCVSGRKMEDIGVILGAHDRTDKGENIVDLKIQEIIKHPDFSSWTLDNDIAILRLSDAVSFNSAVKPVCLPAAGKDYVGKTGIVTGWGTTSESGKSAPVLQQADVPVISNDECQKNSNYNTWDITDNMMCAGHADGKIDACQGDSGGPLHYKGSMFDRMELAGIVSWGHGCARENYPGVYTRVSNYIDWINENTKDAVRCLV